MNTSAGRHTTFEVERTIAAAPERVFAFWSDRALKDKWNGCHPDWTVTEDVFAFSEGGRETRRWVTPDGNEQSFYAHYFEIVPAVRIVYAYEMGFAGARLSVSLVTVTFAPQDPGTGRGTTMVFTEQAVILSGEPGARAQRLAGTQEGMDRLVALIEAMPDH